MKTTEKSSVSKTKSRTTVKATRTVKISEDAIRQKAYEIYCETGNQNEQENWMTAEKLLLTETKSKLN